ncbi:MAG: 3-oxoacyl-ACP reductase [Acidimicrobiaceae bacterium]|nr:3-oxoacyl-ACP reductase [Acidimicrobiaceae bacterium]|tara:strand:+ start:6334 stop:7080 length:747 start_codon:yes stop_codon:yes gene_type:complete
MELALDGKTALITGGSKGIGKAIAKGFADAGAKVMITSRKAEVCESAADEIGGGCEWEAGNVGDPEHMERAIDRTIELFGGVDILVNNAATNPYAGPMIDADLPRWEKTIDVNMTAPFLWTQMVWQKYQKDNGGVILNIASVGGLETNPMLGVYDVTKAGLIHMTKQFAAELAPQVRVNAICPGLIKTDFARMLWEGDGGDMVAQQYPLKRLGEVEDIAAAALYLAADSGSWITGQAIVLDGGGQIKF